MKSEWVRLGPALKTKEGTETQADRRHKRSAWPSALAPAGKQYSGNTHLFGEDVLKGEAERGCQGTDQPPHVERQLCDSGQQDSTDDRDQ